MSTCATPKGPWYNPAIDEGIYAAEIVSVEEMEYGNDHHPMVQVTLWLPEEERSFVTNFYFPRNSASQATKRFWHFCKCARLEPADARYEPHLFEGRKLRIEAELANPKNASVDWEYSDVRRFLPPESGTNLA